MPSPLRRYPFDPFEPQAPVGLPDPFGPQNQTPPPPGMPGGSSFRAGVESTLIGQTASSFDADALKAEAEGDLGRARELRDIAAQYREQASTVAPRVSRMRDIHGVGDAADYAAQAGGMGLASMAGPAAAGVAGAVAGAFIPPLRRYLPYLAAGIPSYNLQTNEAISNQYDDPAIAALPAQQRLDTARVTGALQAIPDVLVPGGVAAGGRGAVGAIARRFAGRNLGEGATETLQEAIGQQALGRLNPNRDTSGDVENLAESFVQGTLGAGPLTGAGAVRELAARPFQRAVEAAPGLYERGKQRVVDLAEAAKEQAPELGQRAVDLAGEAAGRGRELGAEAKRRGQRIVDLATGAVLDAGDAALDAAEKAPEVARKAGRRVVDLAEAAYGRGSDAAAGIAEQAKSTYVGARRSPEWRLFFGDDREAMMGDTPEETASTLRRSAGERADIAKKLAEKVLFDTDLPQFLKDQVAALNGRYDTPRAQRIVARAALAQRGIDLGEELGKSAKGLAKKLRGVMEATAKRVKKGVEEVTSKKQSKMGPSKGPDVSKLVGYLNERVKPGLEQDPAVLDTLPELARAIRSYITNDVDEITYHDFVSDPRWRDVFNNVDDLFDIIEKARVSHSETAQEYSGTRLAEHDMVNRRSFIRRSIKPEGLQALAGEKEGVSPWYGLDMYRMLGQAIDRYVTSAARAKPTNEKGEVTEAQERKVRKEYTDVVGFLGRYFKDPEAVLRFYGAKRPAGYSVYEYNKTDETAGEGRGATSDYDTAGEARRKGGEEAPKEEAPTTEYHFASSRRYLPFVKSQLGKAVEDMRTRYGEGDLEPVSVTRFLNEATDETLRLHELQKDSSRLSKLPVPKRFANFMAKAIRQHLRTIKGRSEKWKAENAETQRKDEAVAAELKQILDELDTVTGDAEVDRILSKVYVLRVAGGKKDFATASDTDMTAYSNLIDYAENAKDKMTDEEKAAVYRTQIKVWLYSKPIRDANGKVDPKLAESTPARARLVSAESMYKHWKETRYRDAYEPDQVPRSAVGMAKLFFKEALASIMARPDFARVENLDDNTELDRRLWVPHRAEYGKVVYSPINFGDLTVTRRWRGEAREALLVSLRGLNSQIEELEQKLVGEQNMKVRADTYTELDRLRGQRTAAIENLEKQDSVDVQNAKDLGYDVDAPRVDLEQKLLADNELASKFDAIELHLREGELDQDDFAHASESMQRAIALVARDIERLDTQIEKAKAKPYKTPQDRRATLSPMRSALTALYAERNQYYSMLSLASQESFDTELEESQYGDFEQELVRRESKQSERFTAVKRGIKKVQEATSEADKSRYASTFDVSRTGAEEVADFAAFAKVAADVLDELISQQQSPDTSVIDERPMWFYSRLEKMSPAKLKGETTLGSPKATLKQLMRLSRKFRVTWDLPTPEKFTPSEEFQAKAREAADLRAADADEYMARVAKLLEKASKKRARRAQYAKALRDAAAASGRPDLAEKVQEALKAKPVPQPTRTMSMTFAYKAGKRPEVKSGTTFDAVLAGERTGTTRFQKWRDYAMWSSRMPQKGERITIRADDGRIATVEVTKAGLYDFSKFDDKSWEKWSKQEGWTPDRGKYFAQTYGPLGIHIEFKLAEAPKAEPVAVNEVAEFQGENRFLSNFWPAKVTYEGQEYPTVEHAYQAAKVEDDKTRAAIARLPTPAAAKKFARSVPIRSDWNKVRVGIMQDLVRQKFQDPELQKKLIDTGTANLQEGNRWRDTFWGVDLNTGEGKNTLGRILMKVRDEVQGKLDPNKKYSQQSSQATRPLAQKEMDKAVKEAERHLGPKVKVLFKELVDGLSGEHVVVRDVVNKTEHDVITISSVLPLAVSASEVAWHEAMHGLIARLTDGRLSRKTADMLRGIATSPLMMNRLKVLLKDFPEAWEAAQKDPDEALAYMYQFWAAKYPNGRRMLNIPTQTTTVFQKIAKFLRKLFGVVSQYEKAEQLFVAFNEGKFAELDDTGGAGPVLRTLNLSKETFSDKADRLAAPLVDVTKKIFQVAPDRLRDTHLPAAKEIADLFDPPEGRLGFNARQVMRRDKFINAAIKLLQDTSPEVQAEALTALQKQTGKPPKGKQAEKLYHGIRGLMDELHTYQVEAGVRVIDRDEWGKPRLEEDEHGNPVQVWVPLPKRANYWAQVWDRGAIRANPEGFVDFLTRDLVKPMTIGDAHNMKDMISASTGQIDMLETDHDLGYSPFAQHVDTRVLHFDPKKISQAKKFLNNDLMDVLSTYIHQATHRAEYARDFVLPNGQNRLEQLTQRAAKEGATADEVETIRKSVRALEGSLNHNFNPELKSLFSGLVTYENLVLLPFMLFSSLIDPIGIGFRSGDMTEAWRALKSGMKGLWAQLRNKENKDVDWEVELSVQLGITSRLNMIDNLGVLYSGVYMSKGVRKINDMFFRLNGMETWNQRMRSAALAASMRYIIRHSRGQNEHSPRYMKELGLDKLDKKFIRAMKDGRLAVTEEDFKELKVKFKDDAEKRAVLGTLHQAVWLFVDSAMLRPTATHRAVWMSDPAWMLVAHLKQFTYSFQRVFNRRLENELLHGNTQALYHLAMFVPAMIVADLVRGGLTATGAKSSWTLSDYILNGVQRSNVAGYGTFGMDALSDAARDNLPGASFLGPTVGHAADVLQYIAGSPRESTSHLFFRSAPAGPLLKTLAGG